MVKVTGYLNNNRLYKISYYSGFGLDRLHCIYDSTKGWVTPFTLYFYRVHVNISMTETYIFFIFN